MLINQQALEAIYRSFNLIFQDAFKNAEPLWNKIATEVPSSTKKETYAWLGKLPRLREWIGERQVNKLTGHAYTITNKPFEASVSVDRDDIEDDSIGIYRPLIQEMANSAAMHPDQLVFELLMAGFTEKCYDGKPFFATDHKDGKLQQSNKSTKKLSTASYNEAYAAMLGFTDANGDPLDIKPTHLVVSPKNRDLGLQLLQAEKIDGTTNTNRNSAELIVAPRLTKNPDAWFLLANGKPIKPIIFQKRREVEFTSLDEATNENVFKRREFLYGVDYRGNVGYSLWQLGFGSTGADAE